MKPKFAILFFLSLLISGCQSKQSLLSEEEKQAQLTKIESQLTAKDFKVFFETASPLDNQTVTRNRLIRPGGSADRIPLTGSEYIEVQEDTLEVALSFFGSFLIGATYTNQGAREYRVKNKLLVYEKKYDDKKRFITLSMKVENGREVLSLSMKVYANKKAILTVNSNHRTAVNYYGVLQES